MNINRATSKNVKWSFIESISLKLVGFVLSIILARLLTPDDFGILAIVNVFYLLSILFIDGGLKEALIRKEEASEEDYSTMFWLNLGMACLLYVGLFIAAPLIESFYDYENLSFFIRLQSVILIIESFGLIQIVKATRDLDLKKITLARIPASIISFFVGIIMAYSGFGVLSLIVQQLVNGILYTSLLVIKVKYIPEFSFNKGSLKSLFVFGSKMIVISYISRFYVQSLNLIYAFYYSPGLLGLYTKSNSLQGVPIEVINSTFSKGIYPTMVKLQQHNRLLRKIFLSNIRRLSLLMIFINGILYFNAYDIILFLLGDQWVEMDIYLKIISVGSILLPFSTQVINVFKARGIPGLVLKIEIIIKSISLLIILSFASVESFPTILWILAGINIFTGLTYLFFCSKKIQFDFWDEMRKLFGLFSFHIVIGFTISYLINTFFASIPGILGVMIFSIFYAVGTLLYGFMVRDYSIKQFLK